MDCTPASLIAAAKCYKCIPRGMIGQVIIYVTGEWANTATQELLYLTDDEGNYILDDQGNKIVVRL